MKSEDPSKPSEGTRTAAFNAFCAGEKTRFLSLVPDLLVKQAHRLARKSPSVFGGTDDLIQEAMLRASRRENGWDSKLHMFRWLSSALRSAAIDAQRRFTAPITNGFRPRIHSLLDHDDHLDATQKINVIDRIELAEALDRLKQEKPLVFSVIELRWLNSEDYSQRDVAKLLDITQYVVRDSERIGLDFLIQRIR